MKTIAVSIALLGTAGFASLAWAERVNIRAFETTRPIWVYSPIINALDAARARAARPDATVRGRPYGLVSRIERTAHLDLKPDIDEVLARPGSTRDLTVIMDTRAPYRGIMWQAVTPQWMLDSLASQPGTFRRAAVILDGGRFAKRIPLRTQRTGFIPFLVTNRTQLGNGGGNGGGGGGGGGGGNGGGEGGGNGGGNGGGELVVVPLPAPVWMSLAGLVTLGGLHNLRRRRLQSVDAAHV